MSDVPPLRPEEHALASVMYSSSAVGMVAVDDQGIVREVNSALCRLVRRPREELVGRSLLEFAPEEDLEENARLLASLCSGEVPRLDVERRVLHSAGGVIWAGISAIRVVHAGEVRIVASFQDITERKLTEKALLDSEQRYREMALELQRSEHNFRSLIELSPDLIVVHRRGRILYANPTLMRALAISDSEQLIGKPVLELVADEDRATARDALLAALDHGQPKLAQVALARRDGSTLTVELSSVNLLFDFQESVVTIGRDIQERQRMQAQLLLTARLASVGTLAGGIAHELNNPLAYVLGNLSFIDEALRQAERKPSGPELQQALTEAKSGAERAARIVSNLATFHRGDSRRTEVLELGPLADTAISLTANELRHRAQVVRDYGGRVHVKASSAHLGELLTNLLLNAAQAITPGSATENEIRVSIQRQGDLAVCEIHDTGHGVPEELSERIFDPFFTTRELGAGTGLGLAVCHGIVRSLGGSISLSPGAAAGSVVRVELPACEPLAAPSSFPPPSTAGRARRPRILVVDDERLIRSTLRRLLKHDNEVVCAESAARALKILEDNPSFDLVLCDLMMPDKTGMDLYDDLTRTQPGVAERIVFITGGAFTERARRFLEDVPNPHLEKPFEVEQLRRLIRELTAP